MSRPQVNILLGNGQLGRQAANADGTALLVIGVPAAYAADVVEDLYYSRRDAEVAGLSAEADAVHNALAYEHVKDFYAEVGDGSPLHVLLLSNTTTLVNLFTPGHPANTALQNLLQEEAGVIRLMAAALNPETAEAPGASGLTADLLAAVPLAQVFGETEFSRYRPIDILLEGRAFAGSASTAFNLRSLNANGVAVNVGRDQLRVNELLEAGITVASKYANVGSVLGRLAAIPVQRSIGRVRSGAITGLRQASLSGGTAISSLDDTALTVLTDKGYIFPLRHPGKDGFYWNDDPTCAPSTDDYAYIKDKRVINKAARIARAVYLDELLDDVRVDAATGKLPPVEIARFQNTLENALEVQMVVAGEIVAVSVSVDPEQNILATDKIKAVVRIIKMASGRLIEATVEFYNPLNS